MRKLLVPLLLLAMVLVNLAKTYFDGGVFPVSKVSNGDEILRWGIVKRGNESPPDFNPGTAEMLSKYQAIYMGNQNEKVVYLTFDEGYENGYTPKILDTLKSNQVKAVFFVTGHFLKQNGDLVKRMVQEGHEVGNHGLLHKSLPTLSDSGIKNEIQALDDEYFALTGKKMKLLRPPKGEYSERTLRVSREMGYINVFWSFAYQDWIKDKQNGTEFAYNEVMKYLHKGEILLLHAVSPDNAGVLDRVIKDVMAKGYRFGDLKDLMQNEVKTSSEVEYLE